MLPHESVLRFGAGCIEFVGALLLSGFLIRAILQILRSRGHIAQAQLTAIEGIIFALDFKLAATVLKTLLLTSWHQIGGFVFILAIRIIVKRQLVWQQAKLRGGRR